MLQKSRQHYDHSLYFSLGHQGQDMQVMSLQGSDRVVGKVGVVVVSGVIVVGS